MAHQCEMWQLQESEKGGLYCAACGSHVAPPAQTWDLWVHKDNILNSNDRKHHHVTTPIKNVLKQLGAAKSRTLPQFIRLRMDVEVSYPAKSIPDHANLVPTMKAYIDGMVSPAGKRDPKAGLLPDDSDKYLLGPFLTPSHWATERPGWYLFHITITPLEPFTKPPRPAYF